MRISNPDDGNSLLIEVRDDIGYLIEIWKDDDTNAMITIKAAT